MKRMVVVVIAILALTLMRAPRILAQDAGDSDSPQATNPDAQAGMGSGDTQQDDSQQASPEDQSDNGSQADQSDDSSSGDDSSDSGDSSDTQSGQSDDSGNSD